MTEPPRVLVIEDNRANLDLMTYLLDAFGYRVLQAADGEEGVELGLRERPDLILCDINLPKLDGYGVSRKLRAESEFSAPLIAVTALAMVGDRDKILSGGFDGYISKPIVAETFIEEVEHFLPAHLRALRPVRAEPATATSVFEMQAGAKRAETLLVVDDTPENLDFAAAALEPFGYRIISVRSVAEARQRLEEDEVDLILCDLHMKTEGGRQFLEWARADVRLRKIPFVIISSSFTTEQEWMDCVQNGAAHFIRRPIEPEHLLAEIGRVLKAWRVE